MRIRPRESRSLLVLATFEMNLHIYRIFSIKSIGILLQLLINDSICSTVYVYLDRI